MENMVEEKIEGRINQSLNSKIILNKKYIDDEQLNRKEQFQVLEEVFNTNVRENEIMRLSDHFAPIFRNDHPYHLSLIGKTGSGKTVTLLFFLNIIHKLCKKKNIKMKYIHLDLSIPKPCFRVLNDLSCLLNASKRYKRGVALDELMYRIEDKLKDQTGYFILFVDEIDHVERDPDSFQKFLIRRLPQRTTMKVILVFTSNRLNWQEDMDPRVKSFLKYHEVMFYPYNAMDLKKILSIRIKKALNPNMIQSGVIEKIAAISSRHHGDARKAVELLSKSAGIAEREAHPITLDTVDQALEEIERDKYVAMITTAPKQLQAALFSILSFPNPKKRLAINDCYDSYYSFCQKVGMRALKERSFSDLVSELDIYGFIRVRTVSKGRYGRKREISANLPGEYIDRLKKIVLMEFDLNHLP